jgi:hypothetical protein
MELKAGVRLKSGVSSTEVVVIRPPSEEVELTCGGVPMVEPDQLPQDGGEGRSELEGETQLGKRYTDESTGIELLCTKAGKGQLACDGRVLVIKGAKPLPSSD